ncbi:hypothetical protein Hanom_Chr16g01459221 [Helianthus anomalus]
MVASEHKRHVIQVIILVSCWAISKAQNELIFDRKRVASIPNIYFPPFPSFISVLPTHLM